METDKQARFVESLRVAFDNSAATAYANLVSTAEVIEWGDALETGTDEIANDLATVFKSLRKVAEHLCDNDPEQGGEAWACFVEFAEYLTSSHHHDA
jgi:hypothetical protein